jgi:competence protein ComGC
MHEMLFVFNGRVFTFLDAISVGVVLALFLLLVIAILVKQDNAVRHAAE